MHKSLFFVFSFLLLFWIGSCHLPRVKNSEFGITGSPIRLPYGTDTFQFGDLIVPESSKPLPVIMIIHGGCWRSKYDYTLMNDMATDLSSRGYATWNIEYRRTEDKGGGWPNTFTDVAKALHYLKVIAKDHPIDLTNILVTGHSAGGHLALMLGAQAKMKMNSEIIINDLPKIKGIVSLAGITDLQTYLAPEGCGSNVLKLVGGAPEEFPNRYIEGSPISYLPLGIPQILVNGKKDDIVSIDHITPYFNQGQTLNDKVELVTVPDAGHFEVIQPGSVAWEAIVDAFERLSGKVK